MAATAQSAARRNQRRRRKQAARSSQLPQELLLPPWLPGRSAGAGSQRQYDRPPSWLIDAHSTGPVPVSGSVRTTDMPHAGLQFWVAVHQRAVPFSEDRPRTLVQLEPRGTTPTRAANARTLQPRVQPRHPAQTPHAVTRRPLLKGGQAYYQGQAAPIRRAGGCHETASESAESGEGEPVRRPS